MTIADKNTALSLYTSGKMQHFVVVKQNTLSRTRNIQIGCWEIVFKILRAIEE